MRTCLRAELRERGVEALGMETADDAGRAVAGGTIPDAIVWDTAGAPPRSAEAARGVDPLAVLCRRVPLVLICSCMEEAPMPAGCAAVFHRPVRVKEIVQRVQQILEGQAA